MNTKKILPLIFFAGFFIGGCENDIEKVKLLTSKVHLPNETIQDIEILYSDSAKVKAKLTAPQMDNYETEKPYIEMPKGVKVLFYNDTLGVKSHLSGNYGVRYEYEQKMEVRGNVVVVNEQGKQLNTEHLVWDERREKLLSDAFVKITTADEIIYGNGFEANQDFTQYKIFHIKGTITVNKDKHVTNP